MDGAPQPAAVPLAFDAERAPFQVRGLGAGRYQARVLIGSRWSSEIVLELTAAGLSGVTLRLQWTAGDFAPK